MLFAFAWNSNLQAAYTEVIEILPEEAWQATREALLEYGIHKENYLKKEIETKWQEDTVTRSRGILKKVTKSTFKRRYRIRVKLLKQGERATHIEVVGVFQEKPLTGNPSLMWKKIRPDVKDYDIERDFFYKILKKLEQLRNK
jgi:hypothetical protein